MLHLVCCIVNCVVWCCVVLRYYAMSVMLFDVVLCGYCAMLISVYGCYVRCTHIRKQVKPHASDGRYVR